MEAHWDALCVALGLADLVAQYDNAVARAAHDGEIAATIGAVLKTRPAAAWMEVLDEAGVPAEISDGTYSRRIFDDAALRARQWTVAYQHAVVGKLEQMGLLYSLSDTPGVIQGPPLIVGDQTEALLGELGYAAGEIDALLAQGVIGVYPPRPGVAAARSPWQPAAKAEETAGG